MSTAVLPRSFLYVPGNRSDLMEKANRSDADALVLDLEDAVPPADKEKARKLVRTQLEVPVHGGPDLWVRVNAETLQADIESVALPGLAGVLIAKCDENLATLAASLIAQALPGRSVPLIGLLESAKALRDIDRIAGAGALTAFAVGLVDLLADLRITSTAQSAIDGIFLRIVIASAAAGMVAPVAPTQTNFRDLERFRDTCRVLLAQGFRSRTAIHPSQAAVINELFAPTMDEVKDAQAVLNEFERAGKGVFVDSSGRMIDAAVVRGAQEIVQRATALKLQGNRAGVAPRPLE